MPHSALFSQDSDEWYTPSEVIAVARAALGTIDLDPASCLEAQELVRAEHYYAAHDDGLSRPWFGNVWCNPPYTKGQGARWIARAAEAYAAGEIAAAVVLLPARTNTRWFQRYVVAGHVCFWSGRIRFVGAAAGAPFPSALIYFGADPDRFAAAAAPHGAIYAPARPAALELVATRRRAA